MRKDTRLEEEAGTVGRALDPARRRLMAAAGFATLGLGMIGVFLPLLPTTPFVLLSAYFFARSSPRFYQMLLRHRQFGPIIRDWQANRCIALRTKVVAAGLTAVAFAFSIGIVFQNTYVRLALAVLAVALLAMQLSIPTCPADPTEQ